MAGKGASVIVRGGPDDVEIGEVWESGHFEGSGVEGRVRRTPAGWSVLVDSEPIGTIGRDGAASAAPLRLDGGAVLFEDTVLARVDDEAYAAGALALVWLGRRAWWAPEPAPAPAPAAPDPEPAPLPVGRIAIAVAVLVLVALGLATLLACLPIPVPRTALLRPDLHVEVVDGAGDPVPGAEVALSRRILAPGPEHELERFEVAADDRGVAGFDRAETRDTVMPLMMHGVPDVGFVVCASAGGASASEELTLRVTDLEAGPVDVQLALVPGGPGCPPP